MNSFHNFMQFDQPSPSENQPPSERSPEYRKILAELEPLIGASETEQRDYIKKRLAVLSENAETGEMSHVGHGIHKGFLGPEMKIRRNMIVDPFVVDDPDLYADLFKTVREFKEAEGWKERSLREIVPSAVQWTLSKYFGNVAAGSNTEMQNREFYLDHSSVDSSSVSAKELKGKGFAVCAEKAAAAQNLLAFVGMESDLIASSGCRIPVEAEEDAHYYILIHGPKREMIYDPTNPRMTLDKDGRITNYSPAMYPVTQEQAQQLVSGGSITIEHTDDKINADSQQVQVKSNRQYTGPKQG